LRCFDAVHAGFIVVGQTTHVNLARFALRNDKVIVFGVVVVAVLGVRAYLTTPRSIFPPMSFARIDVVVDAGDLPSDHVRVAVTRPLEQAFQALPSVTNVLATSSQGSAELFVSFASATDPQRDLQLVDQAIAQARASVPAARDVVAVAINPNREPVLSYALTSPDLSQAVLRQIATTQIVPKLYGTPGLGPLLVAGGPATELHVHLDPAQLAAAGIGAGDVSRTLADANDVQGVGSGQQAYQRYAVLIDSSLRDATTLGNVAVPTRDGATVPLASLGTIGAGVSPVTDQTSIDATHGVILNAYGLPGADAVKMAEAFRDRMRSVVPALPRDVHATLFWDETTLIVASQSALRDAILLGALLAVVVIYAFLRSAGLTLVAATMIPLAMAIALFVLQLAGQTLNLMSVGGLAVAVGLIIDDAIVVIENIARTRREEPALDSGAAIERSMSQLIGPMAASTTATVVVFLPLALLTGVTGFFFRALAFTLSVSLVVSLGLALFIAPIIARAFIRYETRSRPDRDAIASVLDRYEPALRWALGHRVAVGIASLAVLAVTVVLLGRLPSDFLPAMDEGQFEIAYTMPVGATLQASDAAATAMERIIKMDPAVEHVGRLTGIDSNGVSPTQPNQGLLRVRLKPPGQRAGYEDVSARLRDRLAAAVPAAVYDYHQILEDMIDDLSGTPAPIEIVLEGADQQRLIDLAGRVSDAIGGVPGVVDASPGVTYDNPSLRIAPRGAALAALGLTSSDVGDAVAALGPGTVATNLPGTQALVPVRVFVGTSDAALLDPSTPVYAKGLPTALGTIATLSQQRLASDITTENGQTQIRVTANLTGASLSAVTAGIRAKLATIPMPPGYSATIGGQAQSQAQSFAEFLNVIGIAVALVFAVMLATFRSYRLPLVILTAIPLALIGVALGLFLTGTHFNVSSFMGLLLLVGIVVKNGILLIDVANRRRSEGATIEEALVAAGRTRLRPIVMTTLAAIGGLFPLALGIGQGAEMEKPLAIAVIGGLSTATIFTLIVIPVLYDLFAGREREARVPISVSATALALAFALASVPHAASAQTPALAAPPTIAVFTGLSADAAQTAALRASPDVHAAAARLEQNRYAYLLARSGAAPSFFATYAQVPQGNPPGPNITSRQVTAELQWTLGDYLGFGATTQAAALTYASSQADYAAASASERVKVIGLYYDALKARGVAATQQGALALATAQRDAATVRVNAGDAPRLDVVRADVAVARAQADLEAAVAADANATEALQTETGVAADALATTVPAPLPATTPALTNPAAVVDLARHRRPEIRSAELIAQAADAAMRGAQASGGPLITVNAGYLLGTDSDVPVHAPAIGASVTSPLSGAAHDRVAIALAKAAEAKATAASVEREIVLDAAASARNLGAAERAAAATTRARASAEIELHATEVGYRNGASSSLEVTTARATYAQAAIDVAPNGTPFIRREQ
jgi:multidrug efflux pump subunit AcrB/outer membrane protein TolC